MRDLLVRGLETTRPNVVRSRILIHPGDPISQSRIGETQQKLYDLGIFSKVQTALQNPDGKEESKYVLFQLDEAARYSFNVGVGAELARIGGGVTTFDSPAGTTGFSPRVTGGISRLNFLGLAQTLSLQALVSTLEQRGVLSYVMPEFTGNQNLTLTFSGLFDNSTDIRTFAAQRAEGSGAVGPAPVARQQLAVPFCLSPRNRQRLEDRTAADSPALAAGARRIAVHVLHP